MAKKRKTAEDAEVSRVSLFYSAFFAVYNLAHRKVRKDSLNCLAFDNNSMNIRSLMQ